MKICCRHFVVLLGLVLLPGYAFAQKASMEKGIQAYKQKKWDDALGAFQKALPADIAALEADALLGGLLLKTSLAEAPAREVLHARLEKLEGVLDTHRRVGEGLEVGDVWVFH